MPRLASPLRAHIIIGDTHTICQYCGWTARTNFSRVGDHFARIRGRYAPQCNNVPFDIWVLANTLVRHPPAGEPLPHWNLGEPEPEPEPQHQVNVNALWIQNVQAEIDRLTTARLNLIILLVAANGNGFVVLPNNLAYVAGNLVEIIEQLEETRNVLQQGTM
ncbi:hypothetical protein M5689_008318 [Euphorbia peplus]|nr:hypothetical protein M5689_008318 [Euphorbia peplus]